MPLTAMTAETDSHRLSDISDCRIIELPRHRHGRGSLSVVDNADPAMPFDVRRVFYLYDVPADAERGGHSHHRARELMIAMAGSFEVTLSDGHREATFRLDRPYRALYIPAGMWRTIGRFSGGSVCCVLTSEPYSEDDYVRSHSRFIELTRHKER